MTDEGGLHHKMPSHFSAAGAGVDTIGVTLSSTRLARYLASHSEASASPSVCSDATSVLLRPTLPAQQQHRHRLNSATKPPHYYSYAEAANSKPLRRHSIPSDVQSTASDETEMLCYAKVSLPPRDRQLTLAELRQRLPFRSQPRSWEFPLQIAPNKQPDAVPLSRSIRNHAHPQASVHLANDHHSHAAPSMDSPRGAALDTPATAGMQSALDRLWSLAGHKSPKT